jgi:protein-disulfide isomerase
MSIFTDLTNKQGRVRPLYIGLVSGVGLVAGLLLSTALQYAKMQIHKDQVSAIYKASGSANSTPIMAAHSPAPGLSAASPTSSIVAMASRDDFAGTSSGHGPTHLVVFFDPNCVFCHQLWENLHKIKNYRDKFTIVWVPVAFLKISSITKAEAILAYSHQPMLSSHIVRNDFSGGAGALAMNERRFDMTAESGAIPPFDSSALRQVIVRNSKEWMHLAAQSKSHIATPMIILNDKKIIVGAPTPKTLNDWADGQSH